MLINQTVPKNSASPSTAGGALATLSSMTCSPSTAPEDSCFPYPCYLPGGSFRQGLQPLQSRTAWRTFLQPLDYLTGNRTL